MHPRLRDDLEIRAESGGPDSATILKDPITGRFYRFAAVQACVLKRLDGTCGAETIAHDVSVECTAEVTSDQVLLFVDGLRKNCLLDHPWCWEKLRKPGRRRTGFIGNPLAIKIRAFDPDALLSALHGRLAFLFGSAFRAFWCGSVSIAIAISLIHWRDLAFSISSAISIESFPLVAVVVFGVMTAHEFGHGLALKHYGGSCRRMGLMILFFMPGLYCNVDDAWLMPRRRRLVVTAAGGYVQFLIWAWATIAWRLLSPEIALSRACAVAAGFAAIQALFNFNPLIRLDGYYLLSDWLEIPNLREKSFRYLHLKSLSVLGIAAGDATDRRLPFREKRAFLLYGTAAFMFTAVLLWLVFERVGSWLVREYATWGMLALVLIAFASVPRADAPAPPQADKPAGPGKTWLRRIPLWVLLAAGIAILSLFPWQLKISGDFSILPERRVAVSPEVDGTLKAIHVDEGSGVAPGSPMADMENLELEKTIRETRAELLTRQARLDLLRAGARPEEIERARRMVATRQAEMDGIRSVEQERRVLREIVARKEAEVWQGRQNMDRNRSLFADGLISRAEMEGAQTSSSVLQKELLAARGQLQVLEDRTERSWEVKKKEKEQADSELALLLAGTRRESIREAESVVRELAEILAVLERQAEKLNLRSPIDGLVATRFLGNRIGEKLNRGDLFCEIVSDGPVIIDMPVPEKEIADVRAGMTIDIRVRGYPRRPMTARVTAIAPVATEISGERMVLVRGELANQDGSLKAGMSGVGKILCGRRLIGELLTRRLIRWLRTEFWEYIP